MPTPLHENPVFLRQVKAYAELGPRAWSDGLVPWRVTTCPALAEVEAALIEAFFHSLRASGELTAEQPLEVIEVGAGTGRLGFHLAPRLAERGVNAQVVLTDVVAPNVEAMRAQPQLAALIERGLVRVEVLDALNVAAARGPVVVLAHYLFDSLAPRAFRRSTRGEHELHFDDETWSWAEVPAAVPEALAARGDGTWLLPVTAARALAGWRAGWSGPLLVLAADKGVERWGPDDDPKLARHGSVSAGVDFDALSALAPRELAHLSPPTRDTAFELHAFVSREHVGALEAPWQRQGPPVHQLFVELEGRLRDGGEPEQLLALLERSHFDPDLTAQLAPKLRAATFDDAQRARLVTAVLHAGRAHFRFAQTLDVPFNVGTVAQHLGALELASALYRVSLEESGAHPTTLVNLALAQLGLGATPVARQALELALEVEPTHERAKALLAELP